MSTKRKGGKPKAGKIEIDKPDPSGDVRGRVAAMLAKASATNATAIKKEAVLYMLAEGFSVNAGAKLHRLAGAIIHQS